jgi:hypothetical protein
VYIDPSTYFLTISVPTILLAIGLFVIALATAFRAPVTVPMIVVVVVVLFYFTAGSGDKSALQPETAQILGWGIIALVVGKMFSGG